MAVELNHLLRFYQVAKAGGFTKAARAVRAQQPGLSRAVSSLESALGVSLLDRGKRSVTLTPIGREVYAECEEIFSRIEAIEEVVSSERTEVRGTLRFGSTTELSSDVLPRVTAQVLQRFPKVWPMAFVGPATPMLDGVATGALELALFYHLPKVRPELSVRPLARVSFRLVVHPEHRSDRRTLARFIGSREVDDGATGHYPTLSRLKADVPEARIRISSNDASMRLALARQGVGVAILPLHMVADDLAAGRLIALYEAEDFRFPLWLIARHRRRPTKAAVAFLDAVRRELEGPTRRA